VSPLFSRASLACLRIRTRVRVRVRVASLKGFTFLIEERLEAIRKRTLHRRRGPLGIETRDPGSPDDLAIGIEIIRGERNELLGAEASLLPTGIPGIPGIPVFSVP